METSIETQYVVMQIAVLVVGALLAVGAVLLIKITRRRQATRGDSDPSLPTGVPARPMSQAHADRLLRRYVWSAGAVLALVLMAMLVVLL